MNDSLNSEHSLLGRQVEYPKVYSPSVLVAVPRQINRLLYDIDDQNLPFSGYDIWHAYEAGFLTDNGLPVSGVLKIAYPCHSRSIVESKSLKLYLNSFNMERLGNTVGHGIKKFVSTIKDDLQKLLDTTVELNFFQSAKNSVDLFEEYTILENIPDVNNIQFEHFNESPGLLKVEAKIKAFELKIGTHLLRSNCKVTHQPDWGSAFIHMKGTKKPDILSILQYIVSLRNENHFHEEICEMLFIRLLGKFSPDDLTVSCIYTRRGGIDICPVRSTNVNNIPTPLKEPDILSAKLLRQ